MTHAFRRTVLLVRTTWTIDHTYSTTAAALHSGHRSFCTVQLDWILKRRSAIADGRRRTQARISDQPRGSHADARQ